MEMNTPQGYKWMCLDIETTNSRPEEVEAWARREWSPDPKWKPLTIGNRFIKALEDKKEKAALLNESPIACIGLRSDTELRCLHAMHKHEPRQEHGALVEGFEDSPSLLVALRNVINSLCSPDTVFVGHNIKGFDLPKLRWAYVHHGVRMPDAIMDYSQPIFDSMTEWKKFSFGTGDKKIFISLDELLDRFKLESHKGLVDGSMIPGLIESGEYDQVIQYQLLDVLAESNLFLKMTGQFEGLL